MQTHIPAKRFITLGQFIIERQADFPFAKGELSRLLRDIGIAAKIVNREVNKAGLADILGDFGDTRRMYRHRFGRKRRSGGNPE